MKTKKKRVSSEEVDKVITKSLKMLKTLPLDKAVAIPELKASSVCTRIYSLKRQGKTNARITLVDGIAHIYRDSKQNV
jgi:hypothetical protein